MNFLDLKKTSFITCMSMYYFLMFIKLRYNKWSTDRTLLIQIHIHVQVLVNTARRISIW